MAVAAIARADSNLLATDWERSVGEELRITEIGHQQPQQGAPGAGVATMALTLSITSAEVAFPAVSARRSNSLIQPTAIR